MDRDHVALAIDRYANAWNETDSDARRALLEQCWADDGVYIDPTAHLVGREALNAHISNVHAKRASFRIEMMSDVDLHHNVIRFLWRIAFADGARGDVSIDFGEVGEDGRLSKIVGFFGAAPGATSS